MNGLDLSGASDIRLGSNTINAIYYGSTLLWPLAPRDYSKEYLTIEANKNNSELMYIYFRKNSDNISRTIYCSKDKLNWTSISFGTTDNPTIIELNPTEKLYLKGLNSSYADQNNYCNISAQGGDFQYVNIYGNIMSLIYGDNFYGQTVLNNTNNFKLLFADELDNISSGSTVHIIHANRIRSAQHLMMPATTLSTNCYSNMFSNCEHLTTAPELPATTLSYGCYSQMFIDCTSLISPPELPATTLSDSCYFGMFNGCTSLTTAPELPATTLSNECYRSMFIYCTSLTTAPELPATTLVPYCYYSMFYDCHNLNYIKCLATDISANDCTYGWTGFVASTGTFVKNPNMTNWHTVTYGIPSGWTVQDAS